MVHVVKAMVFPVVMYGCESVDSHIHTLDCEEDWAPKNDAFELWCWRRLLRVLWTARRSNKSILKEISPEYSLEGLMLCFYWLCVNPVRALLAIYFKLFVPASIKKLDCRTKLVSPCKRLSECHSFRFVVSKSQAENPQQAVKKLIQSLNIPFLPHHIYLVPKYILRFFSIVLCSID